jgi:SRI (Set2 Rpb1 interacting) domain
VHLLVSKEIKAGKTQVKDELSDEKKKKIKIFVKDYMDKVMARRAQKLAAKQQQQQQQQEAASGRTESVSTGTPQVPGSTPRDSVPKELEPDTPTPSNVSKTLAASENKELRTLSPTEFLKTLEDGWLER